VLNVRVAADKNQGYAREVTGRTRILTMAIGSFVVLAMPRSILGVAWPSMADELTRPLSDLGTLIAVLVVGYLVITLANGELTRRFGAGLLLVASATVSAVALVAVALSPGWLTLVLSLGLLGMGGGLIDAGVNTRVSTGYDARAMGFLHAGYGVGSVIAPLMMTLVFAFDISWRVGFVAIAVLQAAVALGFALDRLRWGARQAVTRSRERHRWHDERAIFAMTLLAFFLYTGTEVGAGEWIFSLLTEQRGLTEVSGGWVVAGFWGGLTMSRLLLGVFGDRLRPGSVLRASAIGTLFGVALLWWNPVAWLGAAGTLLTGLALGPYFPLQMLATAQRFGSERTPWMAGYNLAAASVGAAIVPFIIGLLVGSSGLEVIGPALTATAVALTLVTVTLNRLGSSRHQRTSAQKL